MFQAPLADMQKLCLLPRPDLGIFNNFHIISSKKETIKTYVRNKYYIFPLKLTKYTWFHHFRHKRGLVFIENNPFVGFVWEISAIIKKFPRPWVAWVARFCMSELSMKIWFCKRGIWLLLQTVYWFVKSKQYLF